MPCARGAGWTSPACAPSAESAAPCAAERVRLAIERRDTEAIDKNYAAHFAFLDYLFGTAVTADRKWPSRYGVIGDYIPLGFLAQQSFPFVGSTESRERPTNPPTDDDVWTKDAAE